MGKMCLFLPCSLDLTYRLVILIDLGNYRISADSVESNGNQRQQEHGGGGPDRHGWLFLSCSQSILFSAYVIIASYHGRSASVRPSLDAIASPPPHASQKLVSAGPSEGCVDCPDWLRHS